MILQGESIDTCYGTGIVQDYRESDGVYQVELPFGTLYCPSCDDDDEEEDRCSSSVVTMSSSQQQQQQQQQLAVSMELNVAYEALEEMRKLNTEVTCQERGIPCYHLEECQACLLEREPPPPPSQQQQSTTTTTSRWGRMMHTTRQRVLQPKKSPPCLICGHPVCRQHQSKAFRQQASITLCQHCEGLFELDFVVDILSAPTSKERRQNCDRLLDIYDRALLLLQYSSQFIPDICASLEQGTKTQNRVGLGSSGAGILSGVLGIVSAVTILTPAGPPLLIASLLFGGSATAVQTGTEVRLHLSEPNQLANKLLAMHSICWNILKVIDCFRDTVLRDHLQTQDPLYDSSNSTPASSQQASIAAITDSPAGRKKRRSKKKKTVVTGASTVATLGLKRATSTFSIEAGRAATAAETAGRNARFFSRGSTAAARTFRLARFAGGSLAAATLVLEARSLSQTLQAMKAGHPCEKAELLRRIPMELQHLPRTPDLDAECGRYLETLTQRQRCLTETEVQRLLLEHVEILQRAQELALLQQQQQNGDSDYSESEALSSSEAYSDFVGTRHRISNNNGMDESENSCNRDLDYSETSTSSLIDRIHRYKVRESSKKNSSSSRNSSSSSSSDCDDEDVSNSSSDRDFSSCCNDNNRNKTPPLRARIQAYKEKEVGSQHSNQDSVPILETVQTIS